MAHTSADCANSPKCWPLLESSVAESHVIIWFCYCIRTCNLNFLNAILLIFALGTSQNLNIKTLPPVSGSFVCKSYICYNTYHFNATVTQMIKNQAASLGACVFSALLVTSLPFIYNHQNSTLSLWRCLMLY